ncbi:hypothetical protein [uncultured Cellulomonas sp.]|uniref:hypothetical protein n=1 Tax=uncultured Cellulomonas sp. TaxID=189682 RepID=UPI002621D336|nr:hypothetical protein [uncultured Cellulomonas sp.]
MTGDGWSLASTDARGTTVDVGSLPPGTLRAVLAHEGVHAGQLARGRAGEPPASRVALEAEARAGADAVLAGRPFSPGLAAGPRDVLTAGPDDVCAPEGVGPSQSVAPGMSTPLDTVEATCLPDEPVAGPTSRSDRHEPDAGPAEPTDPRLRVARLATRLRRAVDSKRRFLAAVNTSGPDVEEGIADLDAAIGGAVADLRAEGVRGTTARIVDRAVTGEDLAETVAQLIVSPSSGPYRQGDDLRFVVDLSYVPPDQPVRVRWRGDMAGGDAPFDFPDPGGARDTELVVDSRFWFRSVPWVLDEGLVLAVTADVQIGTTRLVGPDLTARLPITPYSLQDVGLVHIGLRGGEMTGPAAARALVGSELTFMLSSGPPGGQFMVQWSWMDLDRQQGYPGTLITRWQEEGAEVRHTFTEPGGYAVAARIAPFVGTRWSAFPVDPGHAPPTAAVRVQVGTLQEWGSQALERLRTEEQPRPTVAELAARLDAEARENQALAAHATEDDEAHYRDVAEQRRAMATTLTERIGAPASAVEPFPARDEDFGDAVHATAVPASLVIAHSDATPGGGIQPLTLYLTMRRTADGFSATLIDATTKDMTPYPGQGAGSRAAAEAAFARYRARNPYPIGGLAVYRYELPDGTILRGRFTTTTRRKEAEKFVEDVLTIGGYVVGVLLLLAPEATVTKALGLGLLGLGVGYGAYRIGRNVELGVGLLDSRTVLEAVGILASVAGVGGSVMRSAGGPGRTLVYRAGSWMVLSSVAADAGTIVYIGVESYDMLLASLDDPNLGEKGRSELLGRLAGQFLAQSTMFVVGNRDMFSGGLRRSDFVRTRRPGLHDLPAVEPRTGRPLVELDPGSRLDIQAELIRRGATPDELMHLTDVSLVSALRSVQQGAARGPGVFARTDADLPLADQHRVVVDVRTSHRATGVTLDRTSQPLALVMTVDGTPVEVRVRFEAPAPGGVHGERSGPGRVRVDVAPATGRWTVAVDVDPRLSVDDAGLVVREELDEAGEIVRRLNARVRGSRPLTGAALTRAIAGEQRANLARPAVIGGEATAHDVSAFRSLGRMWQRFTTSGTAESADRLDRMLVEMGFNPRRRDPDVERALVSTLGAAEAEPLLRHVWGERVQRQGHPEDAPVFARPAIHVPAAATHDPAVLAEVRLYTEALAEFRASGAAARAAAGRPARPGPAEVTMTRIEQLAAAAYRAPALTVDALVREGMPRGVAEGYVRGTGGANPYTHLHDVLLSTFEARRTAGLAGTVVGRRIAVPPGFGETDVQPPAALRALAAGGPPEGITLDELMRRMDASGAPRTIQQIGTAQGAAWVQWTFADTDGSTSRVRLDIPGMEAQTGAQRGYEFQSARGLHVGVTYTPPSSSERITLSSTAVQVPVNAAAAHIRIVPGAGSAVVSWFDALGLGRPGVRLSDVIDWRNL